MRKERGGASVLAALLTVCLLVTALLGLCACGESDESPFEAEINALYAYRRSLEAEYSNIVATFRDEYLVPVSANLSLVYLDLSAQLWDAYEIVKDVSASVRSAAGMPEDGSSLLHLTLCLSEDGLPGDDGCITREQFDAILADGASLALYYDGEDGADSAALSLYVDRMSARLSERDIPMPNAIVFSNGSYTPELQEQYNDILVGRGIPFILHYGEGAALEIIESGSDADIFRPGVVNWQTPQMQKFFVSDIMMLGGCATYAFSFKDRGTEVYLDTSNAAYQRMLVYISEFVVSGQLNSLPFGEAWDRLTDYHISLDSLADAISGEKARLRDEIRYIDGLIGRLSTVKSAEDADSALLAEAYSIRLLMLENELSSRLHTVYEQLGLADRASVGLIIDSIDSGVYELVTDRLADEDGAPSVGITLCLRADSLPGDEGCMTADELRRLIALGCGTAVYLDGDSIDAIGDRLSAVRASLSELGIEMPKAVMLAEDCYDLVNADSAAVSALLSEYGINGVVSTEVDTQVRDDGSFTVTSLSWSDDFCRRDRIIETVRRDGALLLWLSLDGEDEGANFDPDDPIDGVMLDNLLSNISYHVSAGRLVSLPVDEYAAHALAFDALLLEYAEQIEDADGIARLRGLVEEYSERLASLG